MPSFVLDKEVCVQFMRYKILKLMTGWRCHMIVTLLLKISGSSWGACGCSFPNWKRKRSCWILNMIELRGEYVEEILLNERDSNNISRETNLMNVLEPVYSVPKELNINISILRINQLNVSVRQDQLLNNFLERHRIIFQSFDSTRPTHTAKLDWLKRR